MNAQVSPRRRSVTPAGLTATIQASADAWQGTDLADFRHQALSRWQDTPWPSRKTEAWRYLPVAKLDKRLDAQWAVRVDQAQAIDGGFPGDALSSLQYQWVDGVLVQQPEQLPEGIRIQVMTPECVADSDVLALLGTIKPAHHVMGQVNDLLFSQITLIDIADGAHIEQPIVLDQRLTQGTDCHHRVVVRLGAGAKASVFEVSGDSADAEAGLVTAFSEFALGEKAELTHCRFALQRHALNVGGSHFRLGTEAQLFSTLVALGSPLSRVDVDIEHAGEHANAKFNAVYLLRGQECFDLHATVEHAVPNGTTEENIRGIAADKAKAVFNGRIHIHRDAQKTLAELNNRNLLLSREAQINTKPELEIYADDVRCAHGATIAELDDEALYYLQSRGIDALTAKMMLNIGFINELVGQLTHEPIETWLRALLADCFAEMNR